MNINHPGIPKIKTQKKKYHNNGFSVYNMPLPFNERYFLSELQIKTDTCKCLLSIFYHIRERLNIILY